MRGHNCFFLKAMIINKNPMMSLFKRILKLSEGGGRFVRGWSYSKDKNVHWLSVTNLQP